MENSLFTSMLMWFFMVLCIYYFKLKSLYIFGSALIIFYSLENLNFGNLIQDYYDTDIYDFQEPVWLEMLNQRTSLNWNQE